MKLSLIIVSIIGALIVGSIFAVTKLVKKRILHLPSTIITTMATGNTNTGNYKLATFAGGCFRCMQPVFDETLGVNETYVGYVGGDVRTANYDKVSMGHTKHREGIQITYDPSIVSYETLLEIYRKQIDPTDPDGQFYDKGFQYTTAIYTHDEEQNKLAELSKKILGESGRYSGSIATQIIPYTTFFPAEEYHQKYYTKAVVRYAAYKKGSGREDRVHSQDDLEIFDNNGRDNLLGRPLDQSNEESLVQLGVVEDNGGKVDLSRLQNNQGTAQNNSTTFVKPSKEQLRKTLTPLQYKVTQENDTEMPFQNEYRDNEREGIYVDIVSGEPLFSSKDKFGSSCGRPSFSKPIAGGVVNEKIDMSEGMERLEVRSAYADSHLGHVFDDGPQEKGGMRYCINSAAMAFMPLEEMEKRGYGKYVELFKK